MGGDRDDLQRAVAALFADEARPRAGDDDLVDRLAARSAGDPLRARAVALFEAEGAPRAGDDAMVERLARSVSGGAAPAAPPVRRRRLAFSPLAVLLVVSSAAAASTLVATRSYWMPSEAPPVAPAPARPAPRRTGPAVAPLAAAPGVQPPAPQPERPRPSPRPRPAPELFERANLLRRQGALDDAIDTYRNLQRGHPRSTEAALSHLSVADLQLLRGRRIAALAELDAYLRLQPQGQLVEEALYRKARTLGQLGRADEARTVWATLLGRFPRSVYGEEARRHLR